MKNAKHEKFIKDQLAISFIKEEFRKKLSDSLNLTMIESPLFTDVDSGVQDDLNGVERPVGFEAKSIPGTRYEIVQSLAKWKRMTLHRYQFPQDCGIITLMKALRPDEDVLDEIHSIYVDQWDWEKVMPAESRTFEYLESTVKTIYSTIKKIQEKVAEVYSIPSFLPEDIHFIHTEELLSLYPDCDPRQRERLICKKYGAVFLIGIGGEMADGTIHDGRAPDYDDWTSKAYKGYKGLNGDILVWNPALEDSFEISSMGIRVSPEIMVKQLKIRKCEERLEKSWHSQLADNIFPQTIGGGIGQSRLAMLLLQKLHIGQVQCSAWPSELSVETL